MKNSILLLLIAMPVFLLAQFPSSGNKQRLGYQTTSDGIIWRGVAADTAYKPIGLNFPYFQLDTVNGILRRYIATRGKWQTVGGSGAPTGAAGGDLTGTYPNPTLGLGVVISANVLDGTLVNADLANQTVDSNKIKNGAITNDKLATNAVDSTKAANLSPNDLAQTGAGTNDVLTWTGSKYAPRPVSSTGTPENTRLNPKRVPIIVFAGESNARGLGTNALASAGELAPQQYARIFNVTSRTLQQLDIGINNVDVSTHGWELELANQAFSRFSDTVIIVKCGQGGSTISQWIKGTTPMYYDTMMSRINTTLRLLKAEGKQGEVYIWWSQGINDADAALSSVTWATNTKKVFANFRRDLGNIPIIMTQLIGNGTAYNSTLTGTLKNRDDGIFYIPTPQGTVGDSLVDVKHWEYIGLKAVANRFLNVTDSIGAYFNYRRLVKTGNIVTNSGILEAHGTDQAQIKTAGVTALSVTTGQQVGVGNSTPGATSLLSVGSSAFTHSQLHIGRGGNGGMYHLSFTDDIGIITQGASFGAGFTARSTSATNLRFDGGAYIFQSNTGLTIGNTFSPTQIGKFNSTGFRIGTGDPSYKLDIDGTGNFTGVLSVANFLRSTGTSATLQTEDRSNSAKRVSIFMNAGIALFNTTDYTSGFILFDNATGNTGIGATTPTTSRFTLPASTTAGSSFRVLAGVAPTSPVNGDVWNTTSDWFAYLGGVTTVFTRGYKGSGSPESVVTAPVGSIYQNSAGGAGTTFYVKESGTGNTGWIGYSGTATGAAGGDLTGTYPNPTVGANKIVTGYVLDGTLLNADLASQTLDSAKLKNRGTTLLKLAASGATNGQFPKFNSTSGNWEAGAVTQVFTEEYNTVTSTTSPVTLSSTQADNLINQGGTQATFTLNMPASPVDGQVCYITFNNAISTLTIDGNGNTIVGSAVTTGVAGSQRKFKFYTGIGWIKQY